MKHFLRISAVLMISLVLCSLVASADVSGLGVTCGDANSTTQPYNTGHCTEGMVTFRGTNYPENVHVKVLSYPGGRMIDEGGYVSNDGNLTFTETLVPAGGYTITVSKDDDGTNVYTSMTIYTDTL